MKEKKLVCDLSKFCVSYMTDDVLSAVKELAKKDEKIKSFITQLTSKEFTFTSDHYCNIPFEDLHEGDIIIADISRLMSLDIKYRYIRIDHIYRDVVFYTVLSDDVDEKEGHFEKGSLFFNKQIYPCYIIKNSDYNIICNCDLTKIVNSIDEIIEDDIRIYEEKHREERDY